MAMAINPQRWVLGGHLRKLREAAGLTGADVSRSLVWEQSKISRIESGHLGISVNDLNALARLYQIPPAMHETLDQIRAGHKLRGWWTKYGALNPGFIAFEAAATAVANYTTIVFPGLLQTPDYAADIIRSTMVGVTSEYLNRQVDLRQARKQRVLDGGLRVHAIFDESALMRHRAEMRNQLQHLLTLGELPNVLIQVMLLRTASPRLSRAGSSFSLITLDEGTVAFTEALTGDLLMSEPEEVAPVQELHGDLGGYACSAAESRAVINMHLKEW